MRRKGQSIVEYLLIFAGIIAAILVVKGYVEEGLKGGYGNLKNEMVDAINHINFSSNTTGSSGSSGSSGGSGGGSGTGAFPRFR